MKNIVELRKELSQVVEDLKAKRIEPKTAKELNNAVGKVIASVKVQLEYAAMRKEKPRIGFLTSGD